MFADILNLIDRIRLFDEEDALFFEEFILNCPIQNGDFLEIDVFFCYSAFKEGKTKIFVSSFLNCVQKLIFKNAESEIIVIFFFPSLISISK